ncbi:hypothetical protein VTP01DRAFT_10127 [Rhizomucor pusillus]|uniref:uncharacterized protein n=1 Tax=Rhizomucor pusillus TaxID=4840 RepID=UPI0037432F50
MKSTYASVAFFALFAFSANALNCSCDQDADTQRCCTVAGAFHDASNECIWDDTETDLGLWDFVDCCGGNDFYDCKDLDPDEWH